MTIDTARKLHISTISPEALGSYGAALSFGTPSISVTWPATNDALFIPFTISKTILVKRMFTCNGNAVSGAVDMGIYTSDATLIVSSGSTNQAGTSLLQPFDVTDTVLGPGIYYMAAAINNTTAKIVRWIPSILNHKKMGTAKMATAFPLPATATLATVTVTFLPLIGIDLGGIV